MSFRVLFVRDARMQLVELGRWWQTNQAGRAALLDQEMAKALSLLAERPDSGAPYNEAIYPGVRHLLLRKTQHYLYYRVDRARSVVRVIAIWHTARGSGPPL